MTNPIRAGNLVIDRDRYAVSVDDRPVALTYIEFELLAALARDRGRVLSRRQLLENVWGQDNASGFKKLAVHISRLRKKIAGSKPWTIRTVTKRGYALTDASPETTPNTAGRRGFSRFPSTQRAARAGQ